MGGQRRINGIKYLYKNTGLFISGESPEKILHQGYQKVEIK